MRLLIESVRIRLALHLRRQGASPYSSRGQTLVFSAVRGDTLAEDKRSLGFVETDTENERVLTPFLRSLKERGLDPSGGLLVVVDGRGYGAVQKAFGPQAAMQRCQWHKRENMVGYLQKGEQELWRGRLQRAYERPTYAEAHSALGLLQVELEDRNQSAAASLAEGLEETSP